MLNFDLGGGGGVSRYVYAQPDTDLLDAFRYQLYSAGMRCGKGYALKLFLDKVTNFQNDKTTKQMEFKITKDRVLAAAAKCSTAKATLEILFPEAFEDERDTEYFCTLGQILKRKGHNHSYAVLSISGGLYQLWNVTDKNAWSTTVRSASDLGAIPNQRLTRGQFKKFLDKTSFSIDEFSAK